MIDLIDYYDANDCIRFDAILNTMYTTDEIESLDVYDLDVYQHLSGFDIYEVKGNLYIVLTNNEEYSRVDAKNDQLMSYYQDEFEMAVPWYIFEKYNPYINYHQMVDEHKYDIEDILNAAFDGKAFYQGKSQGYNVYSVN